MRVLFLICTSALMACAPQAPDEVINGIVVITQPSPTTDFKALGTFTMPTQVQVVGQKVPGTKDWNADVPNLLAAIESNLVARGYTRHPGDPTAADFGVTVSALLGTEADYFTGVWCDYCFWYPGTPYCGAQCRWDFSYQGAFRYGTMVIELHEFTTPPPAAGDKVKTHWSATLYSVLPDSGYSATRARDAIDRAFAQSPMVSR